MLQPMVDRWCGSRDSESIGPNVGGGLGAIHESLREGLAGTGVLLRVKAIEDGKHVWRGFYRWSTENEDDNVANVRAAVLEAFEATFSDRALCEKKLRELLGWRSAQVVQLCRPIRSQLRLLRIEVDPWKALLKRSSPEQLHCSLGQVGDAVFSSMPAWWDEQRIR